MMKTTIDSKDFRVRPGEEVSLSKLPTVMEPYCKSKKQNTRNPWKSKSQS